MPVSLTKPKITFQYADNPTFSAGLGTEEFNIRAVPLGIESEELLVLASGQKINALTWSFEIEFEPFSTVLQTSEHDSSDKIRLVNMIATKPFLRVQSITGLQRYKSGGIAEAKILLENQRVTFSGSFSTSLDKEAAIETVSVTFKRLNPV
jgi:hypothetical protein